MSIPAVIPALPDRLWVFTGELHPLIVHFPIALIVVALCFELLRRRRDNRPSTTALGLLTIGAGVAIVAAIGGWSSAETSGQGDEGVFVHRWLGVATAVVATIAAGVGWLATAGVRRDADDRVARGSHGVLCAYRAAAILAAGLVAGAGHVGGELVHGPGYLGDALAALTSPGRTRSPADAAPSSRVATVADASAPAAGRGLSFVADIRPILARRCFACHTGVDATAELNLDDRANLLRGGEGGQPAIVPGDPDASRLLLVVDGRDAEISMPPKGGPLEPAQIATIRAWIAQGAPWAPADERTAGAAADHWHWAYRAPVRANPPPVVDTRWARNAIDSFVLARLEREQLVPSPEADRSTLLRRASLDLTGLPPTIAELDAFLADPRLDAYERAVDRLLDSPHFGEHWARMWLDLARYADTHGYEKDDRRSMWPWRNWVIDAFNRDLPFDQFALEQLAGDLLPRGTIDQLIATGFSRNSMINEEGGVDPAEFQAEATIDRVNTFASVFLGSTVACAQCHDHKYDPIPQRDYYRLYAFFNQDAADTRRIGLHENRSAGPTAPKVAEKDRDRADALVQERAALAGARSTGVRELCRKVTLRGLTIELDRLGTASTLVMGGDTTPRPTHVFVRGSFLSPGDLVSPSTPEMLPSMADELPRNRLGLARWLADPANPLTARVAVNRLWERLFGRGLVATSDDFGTQGDAPTHPELLDWLATEYPLRGWSTKSMLRLIANSATYRQSSVVTPELRERDPENRLLARMSRFRLDAETIRDTALVASGLLAPTIGGPSVFPPQPPGIWTMIYSNDQWKESEGADRHRRGLYTFWRRTAPYPSFMAFDASSRELACTRRPRTNTPLQALVTLNDPAFVEAATALARRVRREAGGDVREQIVQGFRLCTARTPDDGEINRLSALLEAQRAAFAATPEDAAALLAPFGGADNDDAIDLAAMQIVSSVLLNLDETLTRE